MKHAQTKFTYQFLRTFPTKGHKGLKNLDASIVIKSKNSKIFTPKQHEAARRILSKPIKKVGSKLNIRIMPNISISKKPLQTRMGKGKGKPDSHIACLKKGAPLFAIHGYVPLSLIKKLYRRVNFRLPVYSKLVLNKKIAGIRHKIKFTQAIHVKKEL